VSSDAVFVIQAHLSLPKMPRLQKECPVCHHMVAINYVRGKEVQRCFCGARQSSRGGGDATLLALRQYDKRRAELNER
jgi:hypothetical protein